jgi:hypothetical protein
MRIQLTLVALCGLWLGLGCTGDNPDYCDESKPCAPGYACHLPTNSCHPAVDGGADATVDIGADAMMDAPWGDAARVDATPDLPGDSTSDVGSDLTVDTIKKANGVACTGNSECTSGVCQATEKVCCDKACAGACESCLLASKKGTCSLKAASTVCGAANKCVNGASSSYIEKHRCDGKAATCPKTTAACTAPYKCASATACATSCKDNSGCTTKLCDLYDKKNTCPNASSICFVDAKISGGSGTQASPYNTINMCVATSMFFVSFGGGI